MTKVEAPFNVKGAAGGLTNEEKAESSAIEDNSRSDSRERKPPGLLPTIFENERHLVIQFVYLPAVSCYMSSMLDKSCRGRAEKSGEVSSVPKILGNVQFNGFSLPFLLDLIDDCPTHFLKRASSLRPAGVQSLRITQSLRIAQLRGGGGFDPSIFSGMVLGYLLARLAGESISLYTHHLNCD